MQKIMFSEKYGLESAVLSKLKTMTRRVITDVNAIQILQELEDDGWRHTADIQIVIDKYSRYKVGEVVAVAQSYKDAGIDPHFLMFQPIKGSTFFAEMEIEAMFTGGWNNKMFVRTDLMPRQIRMTGIKLERLQDISDEDCLKEGILIDENRKAIDNNIYCFDVVAKHTNRWYFPTPKLAFETLINKVSPKMEGKPIWDANPFVFVYSFEVVK